MRTISHPTDRTPPGSGGRFAFRPAYLVAVVLVTLLAACGTAPEPDAPPALVVAFSEPGLEPQRLEGTLLHDVARVSVRGGRDLTEVRFHVDDPQVERAPAFVDREAPFEYRLEVAELEPGEHLLTIEAEPTHGRTIRTTETFRVAAPEIEEPTVPEAPTTDEPVEETPTEEVPVEEAPSSEPETGDEDGAEAADPWPTVDVWVAPEGSGDGRSANSPMGLQRAIEGVRPGNVVHLMDGIYPIDVRFVASGTPDRPITWTAAPGAPAVFDGSGHAPVASTARFHVDGAAWNVFENLEVRNGPQEGVLVENAHDNVFRNVVAHGHHYSGIRAVASDRNLYEDVVVFDNYDDQNPQGLYGEEADGVTLASGDSNVLRRVVSYDNSDDGIDVGRSTNTLVEYAFVYRNGRGSHGNGNGVKAGGGGAWNATIVRNSIALGNASNGFNENGGEGILFENNTALGNGGYSFMGGSTTTRRNNVAVGGDVGMWGARDENNGWDLGIADPRFASTTYGDDGFLALAPGSPAIGAGVGGADLGAIPAGRRLVDLLGPYVLDAIVDVPVVEQPVVEEAIVEEPIGEEDTSGSASAATWWVAPDGWGDGRSASSPTSAQRAASMVSPGDVVYLRGGVYPIGVRFTRSGTSSQPIVWTSAPGEWAVFDGSDQTPIASSAKFHVSGADWNVFENLEVRHGPQEGIYVDASHDNVFRNIVTHGHQYSGIGNVGSDRNLYEGVTTYDNYDDHNPRGLYGDDADGIALSSGDSNVVRRVVTYHNSDDGIDAWRSTNTLIEHVVSYGNGRGSHGNGNGIKAGGASEWNATIVRSSIAFGNKANGFDDNSGQGILFENNTAFDNGGYSFMGGSTTTRRNNIAVGGTVGMWGARDSNNTWDLGIRDPWFASTVHGDDGFLALAAGSPAIGAGVGGADLGAIPADRTYADLTGTRVLGGTAGID